MKIIALYGFVEVIGYRSELYSRTSSSCFRSDDLSMVIKMENEDSFPDQFLNIKKLSLTIYHQLDSLRERDLADTRQPENIV